MAALFAVAWRPATRAVGGGALEEIALVSQCSDIVLVAQCPDITPVNLREAGKSTTDQAKHKPTWYLHG